MACIINASSAYGLVSTADTSGQLSFQSNGGNTITVPQVAGTMITTGSPQSGSVIQVVYGRCSNNRYSTNSTSFVSLGSTLAITPKFSTSKILIRYFASVNVSSTTGDAYFDLARTVSGVTTQNISGYSAGILSLSNSTVWGSTQVEYLDSPATTSTVTYGPSVAMNSSSYAVYFNDNSGNTGTSFVLMEIAA